MRRSRHPSGHPAGLTVLEIMIVIAILGATALVMRGGFRMLTQADLVESATELATVLRRTNQLAIEKGEMHRVVFDLEPRDANKPEDSRRPDYWVEVCQGPATIVRNEQLKTDEQERIAAIERGKNQMAQLPP